ncbi:UspA [Macleaya cordata]|uniref:UspA n=1 Tax=Macleaya cordata TaxID=56857 RepID=A0A200RAL9_MACCD|nr:UspA [Macleaya cordata]
MEMEMKMKEKFIDDLDDELFISGFNNIRVGGGGGGGGGGDGGGGSSSSVSEIEEIGDSSSSSSSSSSTGGSYNERLKIKHRIPATIKEEFEGSVVSSDHGNNNIYVAVGKSNSSMDALRWALKHLVNPVSLLSTSIYLIHVFPEVRFIPSPMGKFHKDQVSPGQLENYMNQESDKRRDFLQKFLNICSLFKVKVDTLLIESDDIAKAVIDLILILNIKKLVVGTTKSSLRKLRRANGIADQILKSASDTCDIKIICDGKEVIIDQTLINESPSSRRSSSSGNVTDVEQQDDQNEGSLSPCTCFTTKFM